MDADDQIDTRLRNLLSRGERDPDDRFVLRVRQAVIAEEQLAAARNAAWRKFGIEMAATGAVVLAFLLLGRGASELPDGAVPFHHPAMIGFLLLGLWVTVSMRPGIAER